MCAKIGGLAVLFFAKSSQPYVEILQSKLANNFKNDMKKGQYDEIKDEI